jgi:hypothetical protein
MRSVSRMIVSLAASVAFVACSTAAAAATPAPQGPPAPNAWMMLSVLSPSGSVALGGANAAAAQPQSDVPPPPPAYAGGPVFGAEVLAFVLWFGLIAVALTASGHNGHANSPA